MSVGGHTKRDCLIVGGGVVGLSLAYELARHGQRVTLMERGRLGREASWAGAGLLPPANRDTARDPMEVLRGLSHDLHPQWAARLLEHTGIDTGYTRCGGIYLARQVGESASLAGLASAMSARGIEVRPLTRPEMTSLEPALDAVARSGRLRSAYLFPDEAQLCNPHHLAALRHACANLGVELLEHVEAQSFSLGSQGITAVSSNRGELVAAQYCLTCGPWTQRLLTELGIRSGILPVRGQMVLFHCEDGPPCSHILNEGPRYVVPRADGHVLVGSTEEEVGFDKNTTVEGVAALTSLAGELLPQLTPQRVVRSWAGLRPASFDGFPYLGQVPGLTNAFVAAGHFRSGLHLSTGTAVVMGRLMRGLDPGLDVSPFRVGR